MEINAGHPVIEHLRAVAANAAATDKVNDWIDVLYDQALLTEGSALEDPNRFARLVTSLLMEVASAAGATTAAAAPSAQK
jgi:molecular chaperone HtpG